ncbi:hypothetical protein GF371_02870 [Candidatus Woesearchaeota archaeon]|nr:hypothetical protein [Candidatus Woesearchaeota archaeon]
MEIIDTFYLADEVINTLSELEEDLELNKLDPSTGIAWKGKRKTKIRKLLKDLYILFKFEGDNPKIIRLITRTKGLIEFLQKIAKAYEGDPVLERWLMKLPPHRSVEDLNSAVEEIIKGLKKWEKIIKKKMHPIGEGNAHLENLPTHPNSDMFYVKAMELNPYCTMETKHSLRADQAERQANRTTEDLLRFDPKDPIKGRRIWRPKDTGRAPASGLIVTEGHHRLNEIYKRYLKGEISGDTLIEFVKIEY